MDARSSAAELFREAPGLDAGVLLAVSSQQSGQSRTIDAFTAKWSTYRDRNRLKGSQAADFGFQKEWYLELYGYGYGDAGERALTEQLANAPVVLDAGCGLGYKAAWFAELSPESLVVGIDLSDSVYQAAEAYGDIENLVFVQADLADCFLRDQVVDFISCDQVLHHTVDPLATLREFHRVAAPDGQLNTYVYARKALPRELLDEHFRSISNDLEPAEVWELSEQLAQLGRELSELDVTVEVPDLPLLNIKGGVYDLQRFIYWNFLKCFYSDSLGSEVSVATNFDWYAPQIAYRYTKEQFVELCANAGWVSEFIRGEPANWTGRFVKEQ